LTFSGIEDEEKGKASERVVPKQKKEKKGTEGRHENRSMGSDVKKKRIHNAVSHPEGSHSLNEKHTEGGGKNYLKTRRNHRVRQQKKGGGIHRAGRTRRWSYVKSFSYELGAKS